MTMSFFGSISIFRLNPVHAQTDLNYRFSCKTVDFTVNCFSVLLKRVYTLDSIEVMTQHNTKPIKPVDVCFGVIVFC